MARICMVPITTLQAAARATIKPPPGLAAFGGDDYACGHCTAVILASFDRIIVIDDVIYECAECGNLNELPVSCSLAERDPMSGPGGVDRHK
jgi:hypothetical protein